VSIRAIPLRQGGRFRTTNQPYGPRSRRRLTERFGQHRSELSRGITCASEVVRELQPPMSASDVRSGACRSRGRRVTVLSHGY
jgi:hypothetical protein